MKIPHPIPYQGSKRLLAPFILNYFPVDCGRLIEPFAGAAAVSIAAAYKSKVSQIILNDINSPLMDLWKVIIKNPETISAAYKKLWNAQVGRERLFYDMVRSEFNKTGEPHYFLYLLARCVKASVRYNSKGEFNQSPDNRRKGAHPDTMHWHICAVSQLLRGMTDFTTQDYRKTLEMAKPEDVVYMDPPYQGVCLNRDPRYMGGLEFDTFVAILENLNKRCISYILSYDGRTGEKSHGKPIPNNLGLLHIEIDAGRSSQATLLGRNSNTFESVYLSPSLVSRLGVVGKRKLTTRAAQFSLLPHNVTSTETFQRTPRAT